MRNINKDTDADKQAAQIEAEQQKIRRSLEHPSWESRLSAQLSLRTASDAVREGFELSDVELQARVRHELDRAVAFLQDAANQLEVDHTDSRGYLTQVHQFLNAARPWGEETRTPAGIVFKYYDGDRDLEALFRRVCRVYLRYKNSTMNAEDSIKSFLADAKVYFERKFRDKPGMIYFDEVFHRCRELLARAERDLT